MTLKIDRAVTRRRPPAGATGNFTGNISSDRLFDIRDSVVRLGSVFFESRARTYWHRHSGGQILQVVEGRARVGVRNGGIDTATAGDLVHFEPGEEHWHGAETDTHMVHIATTIGETDWLEKVSDDDYGEGSLTGARP